VRTRTQGTPETAEGTTAEAPKVELKPTDRVNLGVGMPNELKQMIEAEAQKSNKSGSAWARDFLADHFKYTLPEGHKGGGKKKYATEEEREAAKEAAITRRAALVKVLASKYGDDPEIQAEVERVMAEMQAKKKEKEAAEATAPAS
jgi:hypothetical protein